MLGAIRRRKNSPILLFILGMALLAMAAFGMSYKGLGQNDMYAARVNGEAITDLDYSSMYARVYRARQNEDRTYDRAKAEKDKLRQKVLDQMITTKLLAQEARTRGLAVDDESLRESILKSEAFHLDGQFNKQQYERVLNQNQLTDRRYEAMERDRLMAAKLESLVQTVAVSDQEIRNTFDRENTKINVEFIRITKKNFQGEVGTVTQADAEEWLKKEGAEDKLKEHYKKHKSKRYDVPKKVCVSHILIRADSSTPPDLKKEAQQRIKEAHAAVKGGQDFTEAVKKWSEDQNKAKGGDIGCFAPGQMVTKVFEEAAFALKIGEVSNIVETGFGFHVIKVTDIKEPIRRKLEDVRQEIALELAKEERSNEMSKKKAEELAKQASEKSLEEVAQANSTPDNKIEVEETGMFPQGRDFLPRLGMAKEVARVAWTLTKESPLAKSAIETDRDWVVLRLKEREEPKAEEFDKQQKMLSYRLNMMKQNAVREAWYKELRDKSKVEIHPMAVSYDDAERERVRRQAQGQ